ncbi:copper resistance protein CopC [Paenibacillus sp. NEAU-GSW1]|nr:copper resistance protein CopC [Paenibacillus sp. NEAU-GSW1]
MITGKRSMLPLRVIAQCFILIIIVGGLFGAFAPSAFAHATLDRATPQANEKMTASPPEVKLVFSEAIEQGVGALEVLDTKARKVTSETAALSGDRTTLSLKLPELAEGVYTVSYRIVSEDGHPVSGSYVFVVGNPPEWKDGSAFNDVYGGGETDSHALSSDNWLLYTARIIYYAALLIAAGLMLWGAAYRKANDSVAAVFRRLLLISLRALLLSLLVLIFLQSKDIMEGQPLSAWGQLFTGTASGRAWLELIALTLAGFAILSIKQGTGIRAAVQLLWALIIVAVESMLGHPAANDPKLLTIAGDWIHLLAASIWAGGLLALLVLWFEDRKEAGRFGAFFSRGALIALVSLVVTGIGMTLLFLPKLSYLWLTPWGVMLTIKAGLTLLVIATGAWLRLRMRKGGIPDGRLLRVDTALMLVIVGIAAIFTYVSPLPSNDPVHYHQMGEDVHYTLEISPNIPGGSNAATLQVWLPEQLGEPKSVVLRLRSEGREDAPIDVPIAKFDDQSYDTFEGFVRTSYQAKGAFLPYAAKWKAEIRILTKEDVEIVKEVSFVNY